MNRAFFGNFDFEQQLAESGRRAAESRYVRWNRELAWAWTLLAQPGDQVLGTPVEDDELHAGLNSIGLGGFEWCPEPGAMNRTLKAVAWGSSERQRSILCSLGWQTEPVEPGVVARVNSRRFAVRMEQAWGCGLPGTSLVEEESTVEAAVQAASRLSGRWVAKAEYGMAGRGQVRGQGSIIDQAARNWISRQLRVGIAVVIEPWVTKVAEWSFQFELQPAPEFPEYLGATSLETDRTGGHRGNWSRPIIPDRLAALFPEAEAVARDAALLVAGDGYSGPLGVDCMVYEDAEGRLCLRPLQDVNARYTMGRLVWEFNGRMKGQQTAFWLHERWSRSGSPRDWWNQFLGSLPEQIRAIRCSPFDIDGQPVELGLILLMSDESATIQKVLDRLDLAALRGNQAESA